MSPLSITISTYVALKNDTKALECGGRGPMWNRSGNNGKVTKSAGNVQRIKLSDKNTLDQTVTLNKRNKHYPKQRLGPKYKKGV